MGTAEEKMLDGLEKWVRGFPLTKLSESLNADKYLEHKID